MPLIIKKSNWILSCIVKGIPIPEMPTFYTDANKLGMASYKAEKLSKAHLTQLTKTVCRSYGSIWLFWTS